MFLDKNNSMPVGCDLWWYNSLYFIKFCVSCSCPQQKKKCLEFPDSTPHFIPVFRHNYSLFHPHPILCQDILHCCFITHQEQHFSPTFRFSLTHIPAHNSNNIEINHHKTTLIRITTPPKAPRIALLKKTTSSSSFSLTHNHH